MSIQLKKLEKANKLRTSEVRLSYPALLAPKAMQQGQEPKYSCSLLIPKTDTALVQAIRDCIEFAKQEGKALFGGTIPAKFKNETLRDGDEELALGTKSGEEYKGVYFLNASSRRKPLVLNRRKEDITDSEEIYGGCYGIAQLTFFAYNSNGNKGVACAIDAFVKTREGEAFGGAVSKKDFDDLDLGEEDFDF